MPHWLGALFFLGLWQVLLLAQNPGLMSDDSGELAAAAWNLGLPHPPGYPLFNLLGHLATWLPVGSPAFRLNLFSQSLLLVSLWFILDSCRRIGTSDSWFSPSRQKIQLTLLASTGLLFISCRNLFAQSLTAKGCIYTLSLCFSNFLLWLFLRRSASQSGYFILACFLWGLGLAHHWQTSILWVPFLLVWGGFSTSRLSIKAVLRSISLAFIGLTPYLYLPVRSALRAEPCWGNPVNLREFLWVVSRHLVSGLESWVQPPVFYLETLKEFFQTALWSWMPGFIPLAALGTLYLWGRDKKIFSALLSLILPVSTAVFFIHELKNLHLLPLYLISIAGAWLALGFSGVLWIGTRFFKKEKTAWVFAAVLAFFSCGWLVHVYHLEDKSRYTLAEDFGTNALRDIPKGAVFLGDGDHYVMPIWYGKYVRGLRPDVTFTPSIFLLHGWGWNQLSLDLFGSLCFPSSDAQVGECLGNLIRGGLARPLFHSLGWEFLPALRHPQKGAWSLHGLAYQWSAQPPSLESVSEAVLVLSDRGRYRGLAEFWNNPGRDFSSTEMYRYYSNQHFEAAHLLYQASQDLPALRHFGKGLDFYPDSAIAYADQAVILGKWGYLEMSKVLCDKGIQCDPDYLPCYLNESTACFLAGNKESAIACLQKALLRSPQSKEIASRIGEIKASPPDKVPLNKEKSREDYRKLGQYFQAQGLTHLAQWAASYAGAVIQETK